MGSALHNWVTTGEATMTPGPPITEGIGNSRVTENLAGTEIDDSVQVTDQEMVDMCYTLLRQDGWFFGSSSGINLAAAVKIAKQMGPGHTIVTILCDDGGKYQSRLYNPEFWRRRSYKCPRHQMWCRKTHGAGTVTKCGIGRPRGQHRHQVRSRSPTGQEPLPIQTYESSPQINYRLNWWRGTSSAQTTQTTATNAVPLRPCCKFRLGREKQTHDASLGTTL